MKKVFLIPIVIVFIAFILFLRYDSSAEMPNATLTTEENALTLTSDTIIPNFQKITLGCLIDGRDVSKRVINSEQEYNALWDEPSPHPDCVSYTPPIIDFQTKTLVLFTVSTGGCTPPDILDENIYKIISQRKYVVVLRLQQNGLCKMLRTESFRIVLPKIESDYTVEFVDR